MKAHMYIYLYIYLSLYIYASHCVFQEDIDVNRDDLSIATSLLVSRGF